MNNQNYYNIGIQLIIEQVEKFIKEKMGDLAKDLPYATYKNFIESYITEYKVLSIDIIEEIGELFENAKENGFANKYAHAMMNVLAFAVKPIAYSLIETHYGVDLDDGFTDIARHDNGTLKPDGKLVANLRDAVRRETGDESLDEVKVIQFLIRTMRHKNEDHSPQVFGAWYKAVRDKPESLEFIQLIIDFIDEHYE